jgi:hypothetical protein
VGRSSPADMNDGGGSGATRTGCWRDKGDRSRRRVVVLSTSAPLCSSPSRPRNRSAEPSTCAARLGAATSPSTGCSSRGRREVEPAASLVRSVASGTLGQWLALADGPKRPRAEDTNGNEARVTRRVVVDTLPPEPPVLLAVAKEPPPADWLVPSWQPSPSADVIGTLVHRNGRLANVTSVVLGDRRGFVVPARPTRTRASDGGTAASVPRSTVRATSPPSQRDLPVARQPRARP